MSLCEKQVKPDDIEAVSCILEGVRIKGVENMPCWSDGALAMKARIDFLHRHFPDTWPEVSDERMLAALKNFVSGMTRWRDLERIDLTLVMDLILADSGHDRRELDSLAPKRMDVPSGSSVKISYEGQEPSAEVRLQECFGLMQTPKVALGTVPIVMTLLSPAARPIQVTKDLEGFWRGAYQLVRKDMRGRYPKHYWPEDPFTAVATKRVRPVSTK
jgi:ATP-dependent helicase HrpB